MKKLFLTLTVLLMVAGFATQSQAVTFSLPVSPNVLLNNSTYTYNFTVPAAYNPATQILDVTSATLSVTMTDLQTEGWWIFSADEYANVSSTYGVIGSLSAGASTQTHTWDLSAFLAQIEQNNGAFSVSVTEGATGLFPSNNDGARLTNLTFAGNYTVTNKPSPTATPEPATMALFGIGLAGLGVLRRKQFKA